MLSPSALLSLKISASIRDIIEHIANFNRGKIDDNFFEKLPSTNPMMNLDQWKAQYFSQKKEWEDKITSFENKSRLAKSAYDKAASKLSLTPGKRELYDKLIKSGDEKTLWTTVAERDPHPGWIKRRDEAVATEKEVRDEWNKWELEKNNQLDLWNNLRGEVEQLKCNFAEWNNQMKIKGKELHTKEQVRMQAKKTD
jgi:hypothetical protein